MKIVKELKLNEIIREYRLSLGLSQTDFGEWVGVSHAAISDMERGRTVGVSQTMFWLLLDFIVKSGFINNLPFAIKDVKGGYPLKNDMLRKWGEFVEENSLPHLLERKKGK